MLSKIRSHHLFLPAIIVLASIAASGVILSWTHATKTNLSRSACRLPGGGDRCYLVYYAQLTHERGTTAAIADMKKGYGSDSYVRSQCHQLLHVVGRTAYQQHGLNQAFTRGDSFCWSGYYHGIVEQAVGHMGGAKIKSSANQICAGLAQANRYSFDHYNCVHGLGHGFMAIDGYNVFNSLNTCNSLNGPWEQESCFGGVFMENVMVAVREHGHSDWLRPSEPLYPCNAVDTRFKQSCYLMQSSYVLQQNGYDFVKTFRICAQADAGFVNTCYQSMGRDASGSTISNVAKTKAICDQAADSAGSYHCMMGAVKDFVSYHHNDQQARRLCNTFGGDRVAPCQKIVTEYYKTF